MAGPFKMEVMNPVSPQAGEVKGAPYAPRKFSLCAGENEEDTPWEPWLVEQGFKPEQSTVAVFATSGEQDIGDQGNTQGDSKYHTVCVGANDRAKNMVFPSGDPSIAEITDRA